jgi:hypothetical protein
MVEESGKPVMLVLRLKIDHRKSGAIETMTVHNAPDDWKVQVRAAPSRLPIART